MSSPSAPPHAHAALTRSEWIVVAAVWAAFATALAIWLQRPRAVEPPQSIIATAEHAEIYGLLARGFLQGQLALDVEPVPALANAANPYDPALRPKVPYPHDASLYQGKFYAYFGPAPALLAYVPWRAITGRDLPTAWAVLGFATLAFLGLVALFRAVSAEAYPAAPPSLRLAAILALGSTSLLLPLVRRPAMYEAAIASGVAAMLWALYAAWRGRDPAHQVRWGAGCGLLLGLAIASRPTFGVAALPAWMILSGPATRGGLNLRWHRGITAATVAGGCVVALLLAYNQARFGSPFEFGQKYQLASLNENTVQHFGLRFVPTQAWLYLVAPLQWSWFFPFVEAPPLASRPAGFGLHELSFGLITNLPFVALAAWTFVQVGRKDARNPIATPLLVGFGSALGPMLLYYYSCVRYQTEFAVWLALAAAFGALEFGHSRGRQVLTWLLSLAAGLVIALVCVNAYEPDPRQSPRLLEPLARALNAPAVAWQHRQGLTAGPLVLDLAPGIPTPTTDQLLLRVEGPNGDSESLWIGPGQGKPQLMVRREGSARGQANVDLPAIPIDRPTALTVSLSSLYPLNATEMDGQLDPAGFRSLKNWIRLDWDGKPLSALVVPPLAWRPQRVLVGPEQLAAAGWPAYEGVRAVHRTRPQPILSEPEPWGGVRITWRSAAHSPGQSLPLGASGQPGEANFLFLRTGPDQTLTFGYDHWGKPLVLSPPFPLGAQDEQLIEFWMPSLVSPQAPTPLVVRLNGRKVWQVSVPFFPAASHERFLLRNPIGGSSCAPAFPAAAVTAKGLAQPADDTP